MRAVESRSHGEHVREALAEQRHDDEQRGRKRDLDADQQRTRAAAGARRATASVLERLADVGAGGGCGRQRAKQDPGGGGHHQRHGQDHPVERRVAQPRQCRGRQGGEARHTPLG